MLALAPWAQRRPATAAASVVDVGDTAHPTSSSLAASSLAVTLNPLGVPLWGEVEQLAVHGEYLHFDGEAADVLAFVPSSAVGRGAWPSAVAAARGSEPGSAVRLMLHARWESHLVLGERPVSLRQPLIFCSTCRTYM
jgi:hypothetical protein